MTVPPTPSLPPVVWQDLRRDCLKAAFQTDWPKNPIAMMNIAKVFEGFVLHGDAATAWRYAGFDAVADDITAQRAAGKAPSVDAAEPLPANVSTLRPRG